MINQNTYITSHKILTFRDLLLYSKARNMRLHITHSVHSCTCRMMAFNFSSTRVHRIWHKTDELIVPPNASQKELECLLLTQFFTITVRVKISWNVSITCEGQGLWTLGGKWSWSRQWSKAWVKCYTTSLSSKTEI
jgi:hypothetical protein